MSETEYKIFQLQANRLTAICRRDWKIVNMLDTQIERLKQADLGLARQLWPTAQICQQAQAGVS